MESISSLNEDFCTEKWSISNKQISKHDKVTSENNIFKHSAIAEDVNKQYAVEEDVKSVFLETEVNEQDQEDDDVFIEHGTSIENIYETSSNHLVDYHEDRIPSSPSRKVSVGERIMAAIERRRENRKWEKGRKSELLEVDNSEQIILSNKPSDGSKRKNKVASVAVAIVEASGLENESAVDEKTRQFYCRIRLGQEKQKSKAAKINENVVSWQELFSLNLYENDFLEITLMEKEKDVIVGRVAVDLTNLKYDKTHKIMLHLEENESVELLILVTMSAAERENRETDPIDNEAKLNEIKEMRNHVSRLLLNDDFDYVGLLHITVFKAIGLAASDCFAVLIIGNDRCQTHTINKTHDPAWFRMFTFEIKDATSILYIIIYDEKKTDIVGKLAIPLMKIRNGEEKWYALKDETMTRKAKGNNPRIQLEISFYFNVVQQSIRMINPKERIFLQTEPEFKRRILASNTKRLKVIIDWIIETFKVIKTLFEWDNKYLNTVILAVWLIFWYFFEAWMMPLLLLIPFYWHKPAEYDFSRWAPAILQSKESGDQDDRKSVDFSLHQQNSLSAVSSTTALGHIFGRRSSFVGKLTSFSEIIRTAQNNIGYAASLGECVKNLFNFTVPFISFFAIVGLLAISVVLYYSQMRYILMFWGVHKYFRKILRPDKVPNNEILDLLSRVPDDVTLLECKELPIHEGEATVKMARRQSNIIPMGL
ncbi:hypothetical protein O0L34_g18212 [Tuta absoluta]|nr:hypothetical protein O0L34_g18212 [Tuta absoluta]